jgi:N-acetylmuramidase/Putative peptidoglycan binding domain
MDFVGSGQPLSRVGLASALDALGLGATGAAGLWAVFEVETAGRTQGFGFRTDRRPQVLFERHKFREFTARRFDGEAPEISGPQGGYGTLAAQYDRIARALDLCAREGLGPEPALRAASWGIGQVMGFNHAAAGFASAQAMVEAMERGEDEQLGAMTAFLVSEGLHVPLGRRDWTAFARGYNGRGFAQNHYDVHLAEQYERFASGTLPDLELRAAQAALLLLGFAPGKIDGVLGPRTRRALRSFRIGAGLPAGDELDGPTYERLCERAGIEA